MGWRFLEREGREKDRRLQSRLPQASGEFQHHRHGACIVICARRAWDGIVVSANHVISRTPSSPRNRGKHIRYELVMVLVILLPYRETSVLED